MTGCSTPSTSRWRMSRAKLSITTAAPANGWATSSQKETGQDIDRYAEKYLFAPMGIKHHWKRNYLGMVDTEGGLYLAGEDLAKIGYLYLRDGNWNGKQIVSREWVKESLTPYIDV